MSISFQLYSARNFTPWDGVISTLAQVGYTQVEGAGDVYDEPQAFRLLMETHGITMPSGHFGIADLENDFAKVVETATILGIKKIVCPYLDEDDRPTDSAGWQAIADRLQVISEKVIAAGFSFAWHNHDFEFFACEDNGAIPMDILLNTVSEMEWEADIAWVVRGGQNPLDWIEKYGSRITVAHAKDIAATGECVDEDGWADFMTGTMEWQKIGAALKQAGTSMFVVEHDNPNDLTRFTSRSYKNLSNMLENTNV